MTGSVNKELFLNLTTNESLSTELLAVPEGEYLAVSGPVSADNIRDFDIRRGVNAGNKGYAFDLEWDVNDDGGALKAYLGRSPKVRQSIMLDINKDGALEMGKGRNVGLGRLREALGQNLMGKPWSFSNLGGQVAKIKVKHRVDNGRTYVEVADVTKA